MPAPIKPTTKYEFAKTATGDDQIIEPSTGKKNSGWEKLGGIPEKPSMQIFNWLHKMASQWFKYLEDATDYLLGDNSISTNQLQDNSVTLAKFVDASEQYKLLGRSSAGVGNFEELASSANVFSLLGAADYEAVRSLLNLPFKVKFEPIGEWNMFTTATVSFPHGLNHVNIRAVQAVVRRDDNMVYTPLYYSANKANLGGAEYWDSTHVYLERLSGGEYANSSYDSTSFNRGFVILFYV